MLCTLSETGVFLLMDDENNVPNNISIFTSGAKKLRNTPEAMIATLLNPLAYGWESYFFPSDSNNIIRFMSSLVSF